MNEFPSEENKENLAQSYPPHPRLAPDEYYYNEQGFLVFTENYHLRRGYCCRSRCKHCPYENKKNERQNLS